MSLSLIVKLVWYTSQKARSMGHKQAEENLKELYAKREDNKKQERYQNNK